MKTVTINYDAESIEEAMGFAVDDENNASILAGITDELVVGDEKIPVVLHNIITNVRSIDGNDSVDLPDDPITIAEARLVLAAFNCGVISERRVTYQTFLTRQGKDRLEVTGKLFPNLSLTTDVTTILKPIVKPTPIIKDIITDTEVKTKG